MADVPRIWQICPPAPVVNSVAEFCLEYGVALLWPGDSGRWAANRYAHNFAESDWIRWFAETVSVGDVVLLRTARTSIRAVGLVASEYCYEERFDNVWGFDLQHCRRVRWYRLPDVYDFGQTVFTRGRFSAAKKPLVRDYVRSFLASPPTHWQGAPLPDLPPEEPALHEVPRGLEGIVGLAQDMTSLYQDGPGFGEPPTEDELVAHLIVPFLSALGWRPELIAVKWRRIDVSLFVALPRSPQNCHLVIEAKRLGAGVEGALEQAKGYVRALGVPRDVVVTDGVRYRLYAPAQDFASVADANLVRLKQSAVNLFDRIKRS